MLFFVISDIHGSSSALRKALDLYNKGSYDKLIICGDILYHGARNPLPEGYNPKDVVDLLNSIKTEIVAVRGNCESEVDSMVLEFPASADYSYIINSDRDIFLTHGHLYQSGNLPPLRNGSAILSGHTHLPLAEKMGDIYYLNPGSIALPKGGFKPTYGVLSEKSWEVRDLSNSSVILSCKFT